MQARTLDDGTPADRLQVGRVLKAHGVSGELAVEVTSDNPERFAVGAELDLVPPGGGRRRVRLAGCRWHGQRLLVRLDGLGDREAAQALRGAVFEVARSAAQPAPDGAYYYFELVGCQCRDRNEGELGRVTEVLEDGGGLLLAVQSERGRLLVPFVESYIRRIAVAEASIDLELPAGLVETCESKS